MQSAFVFAFLLCALIVFGAAQGDFTHFDSSRAQSAAGNFVTYRNAVNRFALQNKHAGVIPDSALDLPTGLKNPGWKNIVLQEQGELRCYVYGEAAPQDIAAIQSLLRGSAAIGWNSHGQLIRHGNVMPLPALIPNNNVVSVIALD